MKRIKTLLILILTAVIGVGCMNLNEKSSIVWEEDNIIKISVRNGNTGEMIDIQDETEIGDIASAINDLELRKGKKLNPATGWSIILDIYQEDSDKPDSFVLRRDGVEYEGYKYENEDEDMIDIMEYFEGKFKK